MIKCLRRRNTPAVPRSRKMTFFGLRKEKDEGKKWKNVQVCERIGNEPGQVWVKPGRNGVGLGWYCF